MSAEANKKIAADFFENMSAGNGPAILNALADNATWWVASDSLCRVPEPSSNLPN